MEMLFQEGGYQEIYFRLVRFDIYITTLNGNVKQTVGHTQLKIDKLKTQFFKGKKAKRIKDCGRTGAEVQAGDTN